MRLEKSKRVLIIKFVVVVYLCYNFIMPHLSGGGHSMMMMYFHGGFNEVILFDFWRINSVGGLVGSMAIIFLMGVCYEGLKALRDALYRKERKSGDFPQFFRVLCSEANEKFYVATFLSVK